MKTKIAKEVIIFILLMLLTLCGSISILVGGGVLLHAIWSFIPIWAGVCINAIFYTIVIALIIVFDSEPDPNDRYEE